MKQSQFNTRIALNILIMDNPVDFDTLECTEEIQLTFTTVNLKA